MYLEQGLVQSKHLINIYYCYYYYYYNFHRKATLRDFHLFSFFSIPHLLCTLLRYHISFCYKAKNPESWCLSEPEWSSGHPFIIYMRKLTPREQESPAVPGSHNEAIGQQDWTGNLHKTYSLLEIELLKLPKSGQFSGAHLQFLNNIWGEKNGLTKERKICPISRCSKLLTKDNGNFLLFSFLFPPAPFLLPPPLFLTLQTVRVSFSCFSS